MLAILKVRDLVLIEDAVLEFAPGLNVLTGETGAGKSILEAPEVGFYEAEYKRLVAQLETEAAESTLPDEANCREALNDLLVRVRLGSRDIDLRSNLALS